jgi:hypothetical protein
MKNISMNGIKSSGPTLNVVPHQEHPNAQEKTKAAIKWDRERQPRRWAAIDAALAKNPKITHINDRKIVAKNLGDILKEFEREGHGKKEAVLRDANMGGEGSSTKQLFYYTLPGFDAVSDAPQKRIDRLVKRAANYIKLAKTAAKKAGRDEQEVLIELFKGSSYDAAEHGSGPDPILPDYLFVIDDILQRLKDWLVRETDIEWYYETLRKEAVWDDWGNFIYGVPVASMFDASDASSNAPPPIMYGKAIPGVILHRILGAELPVDFVSGRELENPFGDEPPPELPVEHLKFRRFFEIRLGLAPVGASGKIGIVFDQRRVDELWNEKECRAYFEGLVFHPKSLKPKHTKFRPKWSNHDLFGPLSPPIAVYAKSDIFSADDPLSKDNAYSKKDPFNGWLRFKSVVDDSIPYELSVDANKSGVTREEYVEYVDRALQDQWVEEVSPRTCKKYLSQKVGEIISGISTGVESPAGTLASRIEERLYSDQTDEDDRLDTMMKKEVERRCSLLDECRQQRRRLVDENKRQALFPLRHQGVKAMSVSIRSGSKPQLLRSCSTPTRCPRRAKPLRKPTPRSGCATATCSRRASIRHAWARPVSGKVLRGCAGQGHCVFANSSIRRSN